MNAPAKSSRPGRCALCDGPVVLGVTAKDRIVILNQKPRATGAWLEDLRSKDRGAVVVRRLGRGERFPVYSRFWAEHRCGGAA